MDYRNENSYNLDNIFTNVRSTSTSSNDYFNVLPYFFGNNRRYKREALKEESAPYAYQVSMGMAKGKIRVMIRCLYFFAF